MMDDNGLEPERLIEDWAAELRGDVLTREQWLSRHETGKLKYESFELDEVQTRSYGSAAVTVCRQAAEGAYEDENGRFEIRERFRATLILVNLRERWRLAGLQLSPILGRP
jgi:hypothetical protein